LNSVPRPRYAPEFKALSKSTCRPLFTLDVLHPTGRRSTVTGVLTDSEIDEALAKLQRIKEGTKCRQR